MAASISIRRDSQDELGTSAVIEDGGDLRGTVAQSLLACPMELLAEIFSYGCAGPDDVNDAQIFRSNLQRARAPFIVASVCQRWRAIALDHAALWHYLTIPTLVGTPPKRSDIARLETYVATVLRHSRDGALDIVIHYLRHSSRTIAAMEPIFAALEQNAARWRRFSAVMFGDAALKRILAMFSQPMPRLRTLELAQQPHPYTYTFAIDTISTEVEDQPYDVIAADADFLPDMSALVSITLVNLPDVVRRWPSNVVSARQLRTLEILQQTFDAEAWDLIIRSSANPEWLMLGTHHVLPLASSVPVALDFPNVTLLWLFHGAYRVISMSYNAINFPLLDELVMVGGQVDGLALWFPRVRSHLTRVDLRRLDAFNQADLNALYMLENIEVLQLSGPMKVPGVLLWHLCKGDDQSTRQVSQTGRLRIAVLWPRLRVLALFGASFDDPGRDPEQTDSTRSPTPAELLVRLGTMRCRDGPVDEEGASRWTTLKFGFIGQCGLTKDHLEDMEACGAEVHLEDDHLV